jgi:hypothetical protein
MQIENLKQTNNTRGKATRVCTFDVNMGAVTIKGFEFVRLDSGKEFVAVPNNRYQHSTGEWRTFNFCTFNGDRGGKLQQFIFDEVKKELARRGSNQGASAPAGGPPSLDDDLPF